MTAAIVNIEQNPQPLLKALKQISWSTTIEYLIDVEHLALTQIQIAVQQCEALLMLAFRYSNLSLVPTRTVDTVIHAYMSNNSQPHPNSFNIQEVCFYHAPGLGKGENDRHQWLTAFHQTQQLLKQHCGAEALMDYSPPACCEILLFSTKL